MKEVTVGKLFLVGILLLALSPVALHGLQTRSSRFNREVARLESKYEDALGRIYEGFGTECAYDLDGEEYDEFIRKIDGFNARRRRDYIRHGLSAPPDVPYCDGYGYA